MYGACRSMLRTILAMGSRRPSVLAVFPYDGPAIEAYRDAGIETAIEPNLAVMRRSSKGIGGLLKLGIASRRSAKRISRSHTDATLVHSNSMTVVSGIGVSRRLRVPLVWQLREAPNDRGFRLRIFQLLMKRYALRAAVISRAAQEIVPDGIPTSITPNGYSRPYPPAERMERNARFRIGIAARILPTKGHDTVLDAFQLLPAPLRSDVTLLVAGTAYPGHEHYAEHILSRLNAEVGSDNFSILGWQEQIEPFLDELDILIVATTQGEGFSTISLEALAAGVPVIAAADGGITELVDESCGRVIPSNDPKALAQAISELIALVKEDPDRIRVNALVRAQDWSPQKSADALLHCWSEAANRQPAAKKES